MLYCILVSIILYCSVAVGSPWQPGMKLNLPEYPYGFVTASPSGDLLITTINTANEAKKIPALLIKNPTSQQPGVKELLTLSFDPHRGYSGIACDETGFFYLSGDTGDPATCFLRKFRPDGSSDTRFGKSGIVSPNRRCLGLDVVGNYLLMAVDWSEILIFDATTGKLLNSIPAPEEQHFVRDIAIDSTSMKIFGVAQGGVVVWHGGTPWQPGSYEFEVWMPPPPEGIARSGEGVSYDPIKRAALVTPSPGNILYQVSGKKQVTKTVVPSVDPDKHLADSCLSFDGNTLFLTDIITFSIHTMQRSLTQETTEIKPPIVIEPQQPSPSIPVSEKVREVEWHRSYTDAVETARRSNRPMVVYFRKQGVQKCLNVENNILMTDEFRRHAQGFVCVFEDMAYNTMTAYRLGVYRIPYIQIQDASGDIVARFVYNIPPAELFKAMDSVR